MTGAHPCGCCGFLVFEEPAGSYDICPVCDWEDDGVQLESPGYAGGANRDSLFTHQQRVALRIAPVGIGLLRGYRRASDWRPVTTAEATSDVPDPSIDFRSEEIYYWRRRARPRGASETSAP